jgi:hypothetical protein
MVARVVSRRTPARKCCSRSAIRVAPLGPLRSRFLLKQPTPMGSFGRLKEIIRLRKEDQNERDEDDTLLDLYLHAIETSRLSKHRLPSNFRHRLASGSTNTRGRDHRGI